MSPDSDDKLKCYIVKPGAVPKITYWTIIVPEPTNKIKWIVKESQFPKEGRQGNRMKTDGTNKNKQLQP